MCIRDRNWWDALAPIVNAEQPDLIARNAKEPNMLPDTFLSLIHI